MSILTWSKDNVKAWLKGEEFEEHAGHLAKLNGKKLAAAKQESFRQKFGDDPLGQASDLFQAVKLVLLKQRRSGNLSEADFIDYMDTRGK